MPDIIADLAVAGAPKDEPFVQTLRLVEGKQTLAVARWHAAGSPGEGVVQILHLQVHPEHRRKGHGGRILKEALRNSAQYFRGRREKFRRAWVGVEQKQQVIARAFLTSNGFHHMGTLSEILRDEDLLVYTRAFD